MKLTKEEFVGKLNGRQGELAQMLIDEVPVEDMFAANFGQLQVVEMAHRVRREVAGMEEFVIEVPEPEVAVAAPLPENSMDKIGVEDAVVEDALDSDETAGEPKKKMTNEPLESSCCEG